MGRTMTRRRMLAASVGMAAAGLALRGERARPEPGARVTVYKSPTCGCCEAWVTHVRQQGLDVRVEHPADMDAVKRHHGVPPALESCHTALLQGFVIEGHVPGDLIVRMLRERPRAAGLAVPGMPIGSPGMEVPGVPAERYEIVTFDQRGKTGVFAVR